MESDRLLHNDGEDEVIFINQELIKLNFLMIGESQLETFSKHETKMMIVRIMSDKGGSTQLQLKRSQSAYLSPVMFNNI